MTDLELAICEGCSDGPGELYADNYAKSKVGIRAAKKALKDVHDISKKDVISSNDYKRSKKQCEVTKADLNSLINDIKSR